MPAGRFYRYRPKPRKPTNEPYERPGSKVYNRLTHSKNLKTQVHKLTREVAKLSGNYKPEYKQADYLSSFTVTNAGTIVMLSGVSQGDSVIERTGNKVQMKSIFLRYQGNIDPASTRSDFIRIVVFVWNDGNTPSMSTLFENVTNPLSPLNRDWSSQYRILLDRIHTVNPTNMDFIGKKYIKLDHEAEWSDAISTNDVKGSIWLMLQSFDTPRTPTVEFTSRIMYTDS